MTPPSTDVLAIGLPADLAEQLKERLRSLALTFHNMDLSEIGTQKAALPDAALIILFTSAPLRVQTVVQVIDRGRPVVVIHRGLSLEERLRVYQAGVAELVDASSGSREIVARVRTVLENTPNNFSDDPSAQVVKGSLSDMSLEDLVKLMSFGGKTGIVSLTDGQEYGYLFVREGEVVDALMGDLAPEEALTRMYLWVEGEYLIELSDFIRPHRLSEDSWNAVLELRGLRRLLLSLKDDLPPMNAPLVALSEGVGSLELEQEELELLESLDGRKTLLDNLRNSRHEPEYFLELMKGLYAKGLVGVVEEAPSPGRLLSTEDRALQGIPVLLGSEGGRKHAGVIRSKHQFGGKVPNRPGLSRTDILRIRDFFRRE